MKRRHLASIGCLCLSLPLLACTGPQYNAAPPSPEETAVKSATLSPPPAIRPIANVLLWPKTAALPDSGKPENPGDKPYLVPYLLDDGQEHPLVIVCPGGGYGMLADYEGGPIAQMLNAGGFHAAVLMYRLGPKYHHPTMLNDAQRAVRLVRQRAAEWKVKGGKVAILGFSAGGHLTSTLATHFDDYTSPDDDLAATISARPDAAVLCYAVVSFGLYGHTGSRDNLLGKNPDPALVEKLSNEKAVTARTPPTFLWHTADDPVVPVQNALSFAAACREHKVPVEMHVYETGAHGLALRSKDRSISTWPQHCVAFLKRHLR